MEGDGAEEKKGLRHENVGVQFRDSFVGEGSVYGINSTDPLQHTYDPRPIPPSLPYHSVRAVFTHTFTVIHHTLPIPL